MIIVVVPAAVFAGGEREEGSSTEGSAEHDRNQNQDRQGNGDSAPRERRSQQKELLSTIGVHAFPDDIAAVDFALTSLTGEETRLQDHRGRVVFLNFWATWCPPCREEMPAMEVMHSRFRGLPFRILAVSVQEDRNTVDRYIQEYGYTFPVLLDHSGRVASHYGVRGLPTTYFVSSDGFVLGMLIGILDWKDERILSVLNDVLSLETANDER